MADGEATPSAFVTEREFQHHTRIGASTLRRWIADGRVPSVKLGGRRMIPRAFLERLIADAGQPR